MNSQPIKIIFASNSGWVSYLIRRITWSKYSHVGILEDGHVIESQGRSAWSVLLVLMGIRKNSTKLGGVVRTPLNEFLKSYPIVRIAYIDGDINIAKNMVNKVAYDAWGIIGIWQRKRIDCEDKMNCSKLIWLCAEHTRKSFAYRATPQSLLEISRDTYHVK